MAKAIFFIEQVIIQMRPFALENNKGKFNNYQFRDTGNFEHKTQNEDKTKNPTPKNKKDEQHILPYPPKNKLIKGGEPIYLRRVSSSSFL